MTLVYAERPGTRPYRNDLTFKPYVYGGKGKDELTAFMDDIDEPRAAVRRHRKGQRDLAPCGTEAAYRRHKRRGEPVDEACRQACARDAADHKEARNARRREAYRALRDSGLSWREIRNGATS